MATGNLSAMAKLAKVNAWALFNMKEDRTESTNLGSKHPEKVVELAAQWETWAKRALVKPWPWDVDESAAVSAK